MRGYMFHKQHRYTIITILLLGVVYECVVVLFVHPIVPRGSTFAPLVYASITIFFLFLFTGVRSAVRQAIRRVLLGTRIRIEQIEPRVISIFAQYTDKKELASQVVELIRDATGSRSIDIFLRTEAKEFVSVLDDKRVSNDAVRMLLLSNTKDAQVIICDKSDHASVVEYARVNDVQLIAPLVVNSILIGWIECGVTRRAFMDDTVYIFEHIRPLLSVAFHRVMIDLKFSLRITQLVALNHISQTMNSSLNVKETLETIMDSIIDLVHVDRALMYLVSDDGKFCSPRIGRGLSEDIRLDFTVEIEKSIFSHIMKYRQPMVVTDAMNDDRVNKTYAAFVQTTSFIIVPVVSKEKVIGVIGVDNLHSGKSVAEINVELLVTLANHAAIALSNSKLYEQVQNFNIDLQKKVDEATTHLRALLEMKSHFLSVASHQLRTPTTVIKGMLSMIEEDSELPQDKLREFAHHAYMSSGRLERIVNELLSATELEDPQVRVHIQEVDVQGIVQEVVEHLRPLAVQRGNSLVIDMQLDRVHIDTDKYKLLEALANLVDNALRYTRDGSITVRVTGTPDAISVVVEDTGLGITIEEREVIFEKFQRGSESVDMDPNGTGLGLYIVKRTIDVLHGSIDVESQGRGKGSRFTLTIPREYTSQARG